MGDSAVKRIRDEGIHLYRKEQIAELRQVGEKARESVYRVVVMSFRSFAKLMHSERDRVMPLLCSISWSPKKPQLGSALDHYISSGARPLRLCAKWYC